jgi:hypothetical protein
MSQYIRAFEALGAGTGATVAVLSLNRPEVLNHPIPPKWCWGWTRIKMPVLAHLGGTGLVPVGHDGIAHEALEFGTFEIARHQPPIFRRRS